MGCPGSEMREAIQGRGSGEAGHTGLKLGEKLQLEVGGSAHKIQCGIWQWSPGG